MSVSPSNGGAFSLFTIMFSTVCFPIDCQLEDCLINHQPITRRQILDSSKLKEFADDNFKFDKNGRKLCEWVENIVGKGEIAHYEQFLLFQLFSKGLFHQEHQKVSLCGKGLILSKTSPCFYLPAVQVL